MLFRSEIKTMGTTSENSLLGMNGKERRQEEKRKERRKIEKEGITERKKERKNPLIKHLKANSVFCVISSVHPGGLVQGLRVTLEILSELIKPPRQRLRDDFFAWLAYDL